MTTELKTVEADQSLESTMTQYQRHPGMLLPVLDQTRLVGLLPLRNISDLSLARRVFVEELALLNLR